MQASRPMVSICGLVLAALTHAATPLNDAERKPYIDAFVRKQQETQTYEATLKQTLRLRGLKQPVESEGRVYYKAPGALLMSFSKPAGDYLIVTGADIYLKKANRPLLRRKTVAGHVRPDQNAQLLLSLFQGGALDWGALFDIDMARDDDQLIVTMHPKQPDAAARRVSIDSIIVLPSNELRSIQVSFGEENSLTYEFSDPKRNRPLDDKLFVAPESDRKL
jgi:outer membrane lipoprotein-sorting protein